MPILDPVVHISTNYSPYHTGLAAGVFIRDLTGEPYIGEVGTLTSSLLDFIVQGIMLNITSSKPPLRVLCLGVQLWPGAVHWPDFKNPATLDWWSQQLRGVNDTLPIDGIWLDMNEVRVCGFGLLQSNIINASLCMGSLCCLCGILHAKASLSDKGVRPAKVSNFCSGDVCQDPGMLA